MIGEGFGYLVLSWCVGSSIAPTIGGLLSNPTVLYPSLFYAGSNDSNNDGSNDGNNDSSSDNNDSSSNGRSISLFKTYPYLLPCLFCVCWSCFTLFWCWLFMTESLNAKASSSASSSRSSSYEAVSIIDDFSLHGDSDNDHKFDDIDDSDNKILTLIKNQSNYNRNNNTDDSVVKLTNVHGDVRLITSNIHDNDYQPLYSNHFSSDSDSTSHNQYVDDDIDDSLGFDMIEMRIINNKIEYVKVDDKALDNNSLTSSSNSGSGNINSNTVLRDPIVLLTTANYGE